jgi:hypothetical protein
LGLGTELMLSRLEGARPMEEDSATFAEMEPEGDLVGYTRQPNLQHPSWL